MTEFASPQQRGCVSPTNQDRLFKDKLLSDNAKWSMNG